MNQQEAKLSTVICFMIYWLVILERILVTIELIITGECDEGEWVRTTMCFGVITASIVLTCLRMYDIKDIGKLIIYRLNRLHLYSDVITLLVGFWTGLYQDELFVVFIAGTTLIYDSMLNVFVIWFPTFAFKMFDNNTLRLSSYTKKGYIKCLNKGKKDIRL